LRRFQIGFVRRFLRAGSSLFGASLTSSHWPQTTVLSPLVSHHNSREPSSGPGRRVARTLSRWILSDLHRQVFKKRTGPDLDDRPLPIQYVTGPGDRFGYIILFSPQATHSRGMEEAERATRLPATRKCGRSFPPVDTLSPSCDVPGSEIAPSAREHARVLIPCVADHDCSDKGSPPAYPCRMAWVVDLTTLQAVRSAGWTGEFHGRQRHAPYL